LRKQMDLKQDSLFWSRWTKALSRIISPTGPSGLICCKGLEKVQKLQTPTTARSAYPKIQP